MAPVSATGAGVPRQRIDDPTLIALLARLAKFEPSSPDISCNESANNTLADGDVNMTEINSSNRSRQQSRQQYPLDIDGLVGELDQFVWRFQEQVSYRESGTNLFPVWINSSSSFFNISINLIRLTCTSG